MVYCQLQLKKHISTKFYVKFESSHLRKDIWKWRLQKRRPSCLGLNVLTITHRLHRRIWSIKACTIAANGRTGSRLNVKTVFLEISIIKISYTGKTTSLYWDGPCRYEAITWTNVDLQSTRSSGIFPGYSLFEYLRYQSQIVFPYGTMS